jgi:hypothetical protein
MAVVAAMIYGTRQRKPGAPLTWGQAMAAAVFAFFMMFWWFGVIPHQWLSWADNELNWRSDRVLYGLFDIFKPAPAGGFIPMTINWQHIRDLIAVAIYGVALGGMIYVWAWWNDRKKKAEAAAAIVPTSAYGRPLVKQG